MQTILFSQRTVTPDGVIAAHIVFDEGRIRAIEPDTRAAPGVEDLGDDLLIPGLVDIHTDNLEKHFQPRPGALWDAEGAALAHDGQCITAGITTVFDSLSLHGRKDGLDRKDALGPMIAGMDNAASTDRLRADHMLHLRCEVTNPELLTLLEPHLDHPRLKLLSVMDHTPGQRQTANIDRFRERMLAGGKSEAELEDLMAKRTEWRDQSAAPRNRETVVALAREYGIPLMSHDDENVDHVEESHADGCVAAEFPVSMAAAERARALGMYTVMGAPNFVRGGSHSGNLGARECADGGLLDVLASDYIPLSMIRAAFLLVEPPFSWPLEQALATVTRAPARLAGLHDRGDVAMNQRADLVRVRWAPGHWPQVRRVWREGQVVA